MIAARFLPAALLAVAIATPAPAQDTACFLEIRDSLERIVSSGPVRIVMTVHDETMGALLTTTELVPGKSLRQVSNVLGMESEAVVIEGKAWMKMDGAWSELHQSYAGFLMTTNMSASMTLLVGLKEADCSGETSIGGETHRTFGFAGGGGGTVTTTTMQVDANARPVHIETSIEQAGETTQSTITYDYDVAVLIEPPAL